MREDSTLHFDSSHQEIVRQRHQLLDLVNNTEIRPAATGRKATGLPRLRRTARCYHTRLDSPARQTTLGSSRGGRGVLAVLHVDKPARQSEEEYVARHEIVESEKFTSLSVDPL